MRNVSDNLKNYIRAKGFKVTVLADGTEIPYQRLNLLVKEDSAGEFTADEYLRICGFIEKEPLAFWADNLESA